MDFFMIVSLLGGLALFLYGMSMLGSGLEKLSGGRLEQTLEKLTNNVFKGVLLGALVTGAIQSSSATTVIVVGLVNARILKLRQAEMRWRIPITRKSLCKLSAKPNRSIWNCLRCCKKSWLTAGFRERTSTTWH